MNALNGSGLFQPSPARGRYAPHIYAYYFKQWDHFDMPFHTHDSTEIMYQLDGVCRIEIQSPSAGLEHMPLRRGEFIVLDGNTPHRITVDGSCRMLNLEFKFLATEAGRVELPELAAENEALHAWLTEEAAYVRMRDTEDLVQLLKSLVLELDGDKPNRSALIELQMAELLVRIARLRQEAKKDRQGRDYYVNQAIVYLHQNYDRGIRMEDIADSVNLHSGYLHRIFKAQTGQTPGEYLLHIRMEKAKMLLLRTEIPIAEIGEYVGIGSRQYFQQLFKKAAGTTPAAYRRSVLKEQRDYGEK